MLGFGFTVAITAQVLTKVRRRGDWSVLLGKIITL
jgi:hypothetical protein